MSQPIINKTDASLLAGAFVFLALARWDCVDIGDSFTIARLSINKGKKDAPACHTKAR